MISLNIKKTFGLFILSLFILPYITFAQANVVQQAGSPAQGGSSGTGIVYECTATHPGDCTFDDLIKATIKLTNWVTVFTLQFSVVVIAWAGFNFMVSGDNASKRTQAREMLKKVAIGIVVIMAAWLIVTLILNGLKVNEAVPRILK